MLVCHTVATQFNKVLNITNNPLNPSNSKIQYMEKGPDIAKPCYSKHILPVSWPFIISRFNYSLNQLAQRSSLKIGFLGNLCSFTKFLIRETELLLIFQLS